MQECAIGVDLGGTKIEIAIVHANGALKDKVRIPTPSAETPEKVIDAIADAIKKLMQKHTDLKPWVAGIGVAGQVAKDGGVVTYAPNLEWHDVPLQQLLTGKLKLPVAVCNDVKAAAWGEWLYGAGVGCDNMICIFVGTGIGGAIVCNGKMLDGCNNTAGEIGHMTLLLNGPECHCGNKGCFEALAGGWAIARDAQKAIKNDAAAGAGMLQIAGGDINAVTGKTVTAAANEGDTLANKIIDGLVLALTAGVNSIINITGPCMVVLGGGVIEGMPELTGRVEKELQGRALKAAIEKASIVPAKLHNDSGVVGAAAMHYTK